MSTPTRRVYRHADLARVLDPQSIAIVGASPTAGSPGFDTLANLSEFGGRVHLVNARYPEIDGRRCHASLSDLPEVPDCVIVAVARDRVEEIVLEAARLKAGGAIVYAAGYVETHVEEHIRQQERLTAIARESGLRIIGPNCIGPASHARRIGITFTPTFRWSEPGDAPAVGVISQSGGLGNALTQWLLQGVRISHTLTPGNSCDVDCADFVAYLAGDPDCRAIALTFEGLSSAERLIEAGHIAREAGKPLVVFKLGRGERGAAAALSHSGFLAGSDAAYRAAFERMQAVVVEEFEQLMETAVFLAKAPPPKGQTAGKGAAIVCVSGGTGVHAADVAEAVGVALPQPDAALQKKLFEHMPDFGSAANPVDVTAAPQTQQRATESMDLLLAHPDYAVAVAPHLYSQGGPSEIAMYEGFAAVGAKHGKPVCSTWVNGWAGSPGAIYANKHPHISLFRSTRGCFNAIAAWLKLDERRRNPAPATTRLSPPGAAREAADLLAAAPGRVLTEREAKRVLALYGVPVVGEHLATSADDAAAAARRLGYPVALKVESPDIPHKTEAGVIRLNVKDEGDLRKAYSAVMDNAIKAAPKAKLNGVLVQPMAPAGMEVMIGARLDPQFGPLVIAGLGGILVEVMRDTAVALAPLHKQEALDMLSRLRGQAALNGPRGMTAVDRDRLAEVICRVAEFAADQRELVEEIDINPLICAGEHIVAVDALIVRRSD